MMPSALTNVAQPKPRLLAAVLIFVLMLAACYTSAQAEPTPPPWTADTKNGLFTVTLGPEANVIRINALQKWIVTIKDKNGRDVNPAQILLDGGMRAHGHGLPTQPQVTDYLGEGRYLIEGLRLNMVGAWTLMVGVDFNGQRDLVLFEFEIDY